MTADRDRVVVHLDAAEIGPRQAVGTLARERAGTKSVTSFAYEPGWVNLARCVLPGSLASPLRGRAVPADAAEHLCRRRRQTADAAHGAPRGPAGTEGGQEAAWPGNDRDYLVGVNDRTRMGALPARPRQRWQIRQRWRAGDPAEPAAARPRALGPRAGARAARRRWRGRALDCVPDRARQLARRARPKASFLDDGTLWIAKFPSRRTGTTLGAGSTWSRGSRRRPG